MRPIIIDLAGGTGAWSKPYAESGRYEVVIVDIGGGQDVRTWSPRKLGRKGWVHGVLAAPPCTNLAGSGARWWKAKGEGALLEAMSIVDACLRIIVVTRPGWWALENPVGRLSRFLGPPTFTFQPWEYGDPWAKRTCLWGRFTIPEKRPVERDRRRDPWRMGPSPERTKLRSVTPAGFARAFFGANP